jgi:hypothetical protein
VSRGRELFAEAAPQAARLVEEGFASEKKPEARLRAAFIAALEESGEIVATAPADGVPEIRPALPDWPSVPSSRLGGFDLAVRVLGDAADSWRYLAECKWDALWQQIWDAFKLCHGRLLPGVEETFLIAIARERDWQRQAEGSELFRQEAAFSTDWLLRERYPHRWAELLAKSAKSRPRKLPAGLAVARVADVELQTQYGPSRLRVAAVSAARKETLAVDDEGWPIPVAPTIIDWPYPEPGPGMVAERSEDAFGWPVTMPPLIANEDLTPEDVPPPTADWNWIMWCAASFDGYAEYGSPENLGELANTPVAYWERTCELPPLELRTLRGCLFAEYRRHHHYGHAPDAKATAYIRALVEAIRKHVIWQTTPP